MRTTQITYNTSHARFFSNILTTKNKPYLTQRDHQISNRRNNVTDLITFCFPSNVIETRLMEEICNKPNIDNATSIQLRRRIENERNNNSRAFEKKIESNASIFEKERGGNTIFHGTFNTILNRLVVRTDKGIQGSEHSSKQGRWIDRRGLIRAHWYRKRRADNVRRTNSWFP